MKKGYETVTQAVQDLQSQGYTVDFDLIEDGVHSKDLKKEWKAGDIEVLQFYRFEGMTDPGDNMILYVLECTDGEKGLLLDAYGADISISREMIEKLRMH